MATAFPSGFLRRESGPHEEGPNPLHVSWPAGEVILTRHELGWCPEVVHTENQFQVYDLAGGSVDAYVLGPAGIWTTVKTGLLEGEVLILEDPYKAFRFVFVGTAGAGKVKLVASPQGF